MSRMHEEARSAVGIHPHDAVWVHDIDKPYRLSYPISVAHLPRTASHLGDGTFRDACG